MTYKVKLSFERPAGERKIITKMPDCWPTDGMTRRTDWRGLIVIAHPDRTPMTSEDGRTWEDLKPDFSTLTAAGC